MKRYRMPRWYDSMTNKIGRSMDESPNGKWLNRDEVLRAANDARYTLRYGASALDIIRALGFTTGEINLDGERFETDEETE